MLYNIANIFYYMGYHQHFRQNTL